MPRELREPVTHSYLAAVRRDVPIHFFIVAYTLAAFLTAACLGKLNKLDLLMYTGIWIGFLVKGCAIALTGIGIFSLRSGQPLQAFRTFCHRFFSPELVAGIVMILVLSVFSGIFTSLKSMMPDFAPISADPMLADLDARLHGADPWTLLPSSPQLTAAIETLYFPVWTFLLLASLASAVLLPQLKGVRSQYIWTYMICWVLLGNVIASLFMSGGPIFFEELVGSGRFGELRSYVTAHAPLTETARQWLWSNHAAGTARPATGISAFPSLHLALTTLFVLQASRIRLWLAWIAAAFGATILVGSVYLGWHYAVDGYFSIGAAVLIWKATGSYLQWTAARDLRPAFSSFGDPASVGTTQVAA